ncbi:MAG TPA: hypothetical protein VEB18_01710 [Candidatus Paceibacterota bacterium]|nr:hypothetical protein [Candidatus Paceibacterota bacterium]
MRFPWLIAALLFAALLSLLQHWALADFLYWRYVWFDVPMHYLGGVALGSFLIALSPQFRPRVYLLGIIILIIGWEVFEYIFGLPREHNYVLDTSIDLLMGTLGALTTYIIARRTLWRSV